MNNEYRCAILTLRNAGGQIDAIIRMIKADRTCFDIYTQTIAAEALLKKANIQILRYLINSYINDTSGSSKEDDRIYQLMTLLDNLSAK